jgi:hypothetical protein
LKSKRIAQRNCRKFAHWLAPLCLVLGGCGDSNQPLERIFEHTYPIDQNAAISLSGIDGSLQVYGSPKPEVHLQAITKAYTAARLDAISMDVVAQPSSFTIETKMRPTKKWSWSDRSGTVEYILVVPDTARITRLALTNGEILLAGMEGGSAQVELGNGRIFVRNCFADVRVTAATGALIVLYDWWTSHKFAVDVQIADGNLFAIIPSESSFRLIAETPNGKIGNDFAEKEQRTGATVTKVDQVVGPSPQSTIRLRADDGNIKIVEANP